MLWPLGFMFPALLWPPLWWRFGPALTKLWRRLWPAPFLVMCPGPQCVVHRGSGTLCLATEHDADGSLGQDRCSVCSWQGSLSFTCINSRVLDWLRISILSHAGMPKRAMIMGGTGAYHRRGWTKLKAATTVLVVPPRHDGYPRCLSASLQTAGVTKKIIRRSGSTVHCPSDSGL